MSTIKHCFKYLRVFIIGLLLISFSLNAAAQDDECDEAYDPFCQDPDVPLDSGVIYLVAIGVTFALVMVKNGKIEEKPNCEIKS